MLDDSSVPRIERTLKTKKTTKVKRSHKGLNGGAKWQFTEAEVVKLLEVMTNLRDQVMLRLGIYLGLRISELLSLTTDDVLDADGLIKDVIVIPTVRLKGGKEPKPKVYERPEGDPDGCRCRDCKLWRGEIQPKPRRKPEDLPKWLSPQAKRLIQRLLDRLAKTPAPDPSNPARFLFESRKARAKKTDPKINRPITRQQAWEVIKSAAKRAQLPYISELAPIAYENPMLSIRYGPPEIFARSWWASAIGHRTRRSTTSSMTAGRPSKR